MECLVANVENIKFDIEIALENQHDILPSPFPGMDSEYFLFTLQGTYHSQHIDCPSKNSSIHSQVHNVPQTSSVEDKVCPSQNGQSAWSLVSMLSCKLTSKADNACYIVGSPNIY
jgi:hypothetical protein